LLLWGIVAVSALAQNLIKETNFYFKSKTDKLTVNPIAKAE